MPESDTHTSLKRYCQGFAAACDPWPALPLPEPPEVGWWRELLARSGPYGVLDDLRESLPQLLLRQRSGVSQSEVYRRAVLRGMPLDLSSDADRLRLRAPERLRLEIVEHFAVTLPVLHTPDREDFLFLARALAYRCEPRAIADGVHALAINGLIHWGLIRAYGRDTRARLILLHQAPYGSVPADQVPEQPTTDEWLARSDVLRLEHELTHIATKTLCGEMRLNLLDELVADGMGMMRALGTFSAELFRRCLGVDEQGHAPPGARVWTYTAALERREALAVIALVLERARELERLINEDKVPAEPGERLRWLCQQRIDRSLTRGDSP